MKTPSFKVSASVEAGIADPKLMRYASRLRALDKDGNGELDLNEVCFALDQMVEQEKQNRLLKKLAILFGLLSLFTIAAVVGLTAAVVILSKDTQDTNNVLVSKDSGKPMATAQYLSSNTLVASLADPTPTSLSEIRTLVIPGTGNVNYTVHTVNSAAVNKYKSITFTLANGEKVTYSFNGDLIADTPTGRRLLAPMGRNCAMNACRPGCACVISGGINIAGGGGNSNTNDGGLIHIMPAVEASSPPPPPVVRKSPPPPHPPPSPTSLPPSPPPKSRPPPSPPRSRPPPTPLNQQNVITEVIKEGE